LFITARRIAFTALLLVIIITAWIYYHNQAEYTAGLDSRAINIGLVGKIDSLDPALLDNHEETLIASAMYESLVYYDEETSSLKPLLLKNWKYSSDGKTLTLNLKKGIKFHNGKLLTAQDVKTAWERNFATSREWANVCLFLSIVGSRDRLEGTTADISGIIVADNNTVRIKFSQPNSAFIYMLTNPIFQVYDNEQQTSPLAGTGPYRISDNKDNTNITMLRNDDYHRGKPRLTALAIKIIPDEDEAFKQFKDGKLDYLDKVPLKEIKNLKKDPQYQDQYIERMLLETYLIGFNLYKQPWNNNYQLRRALNYAIDRHAIIEQVFAGSYRPAKGVIPAGLPGYNQQMRGYSFDQQKAKNLLADAGFPDGEGLKPLTLYYNEDAGHQMVAEMIARQLQEIGIVVELQEMEWDYYKKQLAKNSLGLFRIGWQADYPDADSFLYSLYHSSQLGITNYSGYQNPQLDKILDESRRQTGNSHKRIELLGKAEAIVVDDAPAIWLFQKRAAKITGKEVRNLKVDGMEMIDWYKLELLKPSLDGNTANPPSKPGK
jgi:oligopeptide transport system substrate-binding protein